MPFSSVFVFGKICSFAIRDVFVFCTNLGKLLRVINYKIHRFSRYDLNFHIVYHIKVYFVKADKHKNLHTCLLFLRFHNRNINDCSLGFGVSKSPFHDENMVFYNTDESI